MLRFGNERPAMRHRIRLHGRRAQPVFQSRCVEFWFSHDKKAALGSVCAVGALRQLFCPRRNVTVLARVVPHISRRAEKYPGRVQQLAEGKNQHQDNYQREVDKQRASAGKGCQSKDTSPRENALSETMSVCALCFITNPEPAIAKSNASIR